MSSVWESVANTTNRVLMLWQFFLMINRINITLTVMSSFYTTVSINTDFSFSST